MTKLTTRAEDFSGWYNDVIEQAKLAEHGPVKGTMIIRPYGYAIWESIQKILDHKIKAAGVQNAYFPLFIPNSFLQKEKSHVEGFSPELAVVTHGGGEKLAEPIIVRPTSETIMYDAYSRWIQSFRDLPLKINQWNNVVRWEKRPYLFLRTTEFLWQEGHTAHATKEEAAEMTLEGIKMYVSVYQDHLALYGFTGRKSETEKFAGGDMTLTYEILSPDGKTIQSCTSHNLGQNFAKAFKIQYQDDKGEQQFVHQTSWGFTTRSIGALIMGHGDDKGLILPPQIAPLQVIIIPIVTKDVDAEEIKKFADEIFGILEGHDIRVRIDDSSQSPGWKFNQYELEGVPLRIEIGPSELREKQVSLTPRDGEGKQLARLDQVASQVEEMLSSLQARLFERSKQFTLENTRQADTYDQFKEIMSTSRGFIEAFWCEDKECEAKIKEETKATTRCLPLDAIEVKGECVRCGKPATHRWIFGQSY